MRDPVNVDPWFKLMAKQTSQSIKHAIFAKYPQVRQAPNTHTHTLPMSSFMTAAFQASAFTLHHVEQNY